jgi:hypothetical protein
MKVDPAAEHEQIPSTCPYLCKGLDPELSHRKHVGSLVHSSEQKLLHGMDCTGNVQEPFAGHVTPNKQFPGPCARRSSRQCKYYAAARLSSRVNTMLYLIHRRTLICILQSLLVNNLVRETLLEGSGVVEPERSYGK